MNSKNIINKILFAGALLSLSLIFGNTNSVEATTVGAGVHRLPDINPSIYVTAKENRNVIKPDSTYPLTWRLNDPYGSHYGSTGNINVVSNNGQVIPVAQDVDLYTGKYKWNVPTMQDGIYKIQVCSEEIGNRCYTSPHSIVVGQPLNQSVSPVYTKPFRPTRFPQKVDNSTQYQVGYVSQTIPNLPPDPNPRAYNYRPNWKPQ